MNIHSFEVNFTYFNLEDKSKFSDAILKHSTSSQWTIKNLYNSSHTSSRGAKKNQLQSFAQRKAKNEPILYGFSARETEVKAFFVQRDDLNTQLISYFISAGSGTHETRPRI